MFCDTQDSPHSSYSPSGGSSEDWKPAVHQGLRAHRALFVPAAWAESTWPHVSHERQSVLWPGCSGTIVALQLCLTCSHLSVHISAASRPHPGRRRPPGHTSAQVGNLDAHWPLDRPAWREAACLLHKPRVCVCAPLWTNGKKVQTVWFFHFLEVTRGTAMKLLTTPFQSRV